MRPIFFAVQLVVDGGIAGAAGCTARRIQVEADQGDTIRVAGFHAQIESLVGAIRRVAALEGGGCGLRGAVARHTGGFVGQASEPR